MIRPRKSVLVYVEGVIGGRITRIFHGFPDAPPASGCEHRLEVRRTAVEQIRRQVFERSRNECENCGARITWNSMHMHEQVLKGKGGEVSLENCHALCGDCHEWRPDSEHGNRRWQSARVGESV